MSRQLLPPTPAVQRIDITVPVSQGGTGGSNNVDAAANFGAVLSSAIGQPNGPVALNSQGGIDVSVYPSSSPVGAMLSGPTDIFVSSTNTFTISNYDANTTYSVAASSGTISITGSTITYVAPSTPQNVTLTIGERVINAVVKLADPYTPSILTPVDGAVNMGSIVTVASSAFSIPSGTPNHVASDWELATDIAFTNVVYSSFNDSVNKTSWYTGTLNAATDYYLRVRYKDGTLGYSSWSPTAKFTTAAVFTISMEEAILAASDKAVNNYFGCSVSINDDGSRVVVGARGFTGSQSLQGKVYIFLKTGVTWIQEASFVAGDEVASASFGTSVSMSADGTRIAVGANTFTGTLSAQGKIYVFLRTGTSWAQEAALITNDPKVTAYFGSSVSMSADGTRVVSGAYNFTGTVSQQGKVYVFLRNGTTWAQEAGIVASDPVSASSFGNSVSIGGDGTRLVVGAQGFTGTQTNQGKAYVFLRTGTTWAQEAAVLPSDVQASARFGNSVSMNNDGSRVAIGAYMATGTQSKQGKAYVFLRTGTTWAQEAGLVSNDPAVNAYFGYVVSMTDDGSRLAISAYGFTGTQTGQGKAYVFSRSGTTWSQQSAITASNAASGDQLGSYIAISGDGSRIIAGAINADPGGTSNAGASYIYR